MQGVALADEVLSRGTKGGLNVQREGAQTPSASTLEDRQLQNVLVEVHGDVGTQLIWEVMQELQGARQTFDNAPVLIQQPFTRVARRAAIRPGHS